MRRSPSGIQRGATLPTFGGPGQAAPVYPVEYVGPERMPLRQERMVEVVLGIVRHAQLLHDAPRADIGGYGPGEDLIQPDRLEPVAQRLARPFRRVAFPPRVGSQPPSDLDARRERGVEGRPLKAHVACDRATVPELDGPEAEAVLLEVRLDAGESSPRSSAGRAAWAGTP